MSSDMVSGRRSTYPLKGQALVEIALMLPILLLLILGAMDFGRLFITKIALTNAAREGANYLSMDPCDRDVAYATTYEAVKAEAVSLGLSVTNADINVVCTADSYNCCNRGDEVTISVEQTVTLIFDAFLQSTGLIGGPITLTGSVTMEVQ